jgi:hypothetical protein
MGSREVAAHTIPLCSVSCELQWQRTKRRFLGQSGKGLEVIEGRGHLVCLVCPVCSVYFVCLVCLVCSIGYVRGR